MYHTIRTLTLAAAGIIIGTAHANAASDPTGLWFDHNGRGAVEIAPCGSGNGFCGYVVHIKEAKNNGRCGMQILGNVTSNGGGWIYSPDRGKKYSVELTRLSDDKLRVVGNSGSFFSKTYTWNRAPDDVARCGETNATAPVKPAETQKAVATPSAPAPAKATAAAQDESSTIGASSASVALMGSPKKRVAAAEPIATETATDAAPAVTKEAAPVAKEPAAAQKAAEAPAEEEFVPERKCKYKIPYVGRVISVPCRD